MDRYAKKNWQRNFFRSEPSRGNTKSVKKTPLTYVDKGTVLINKILPILVIRH